MSAAQTQIDALMSSFYSTSILAENLGREVIEAHAHPKNMKMELESDAGLHLHYRKLFCETLAALLYETAGDAQTAVALKDYILNWRPKPK